MRNKFLLLFPNTLSDYPSDLIFWIIIVGSFSGVNTVSVCPNVTYTDKFDFISDSNRVFVKLKNCSIQDAIEIVRKMRDPRRALRTYCGKNATAEDLDTRSDKWYEIDYYDPLDTLPKTSLTGNSDEWNTDDEMSKSALDEGERISNNVFGSYFYVDEHDDECGNSRDLFYDDAQ